MYVLYTGQVLSAPDTDLCFLLLKEEGDELGPARLLLNSTICNLSTSHFLCNSNIPCNALVLIAHPWIFA